MAWELMVSKRYGLAPSTRVSFYGKAPSSSKVLYWTFADWPTISEASLDFANYRYRTRIMLGNDEVFSFLYPYTYITTNAIAGFSSGKDATYEFIIERKKIDFTNDRVKDQLPGTEVTFSGLKWIILDPAEGYIISKNSLSMLPFDTKTTNLFDPSATTNVGYYLNNNFFNSLDANAKKVILDRIWKAGSHTDPLSNLVTAKVGLLSYVERDKYLNWITNPEVRFWTLTPDSGYPTYAYVVQQDNTISRMSKNINGSVGVRPAIVIDPEVLIVNGVAVLNAVPTVSLTSPSHNQTLYENDTLNITGTANDQDVDQSVTVFFQINSEQRKVLATNLSQTQISLSKQLIFKGSKLFDGEVAITGVLADGVAHTLKVWAVDSEGGQSTTVERTFYVVPNRAPLLSVDTIIPSGIINTDKFTIRGTTGDPDANSSVKVNYRINGANPIEIYDGTGGAWEFELLLGELKVGENTIVVEVVDNYGAKTSKTIKLNKNTVNTPVLQSVARYKISPPKGSARGVLIWVQRDEELDLKVELSMTLAGEQEQYISLEADPDNIVEVSEGIVEDEYYHETVEPKDNIILKLTTSRANVNIDNKIYLIWGVLE